MLKNTIFCIELMFKKIDKILVLGLDMKDCLINLGAPKRKNYCSSLRRGLQKI